MECNNLIKGDMELMLKRNMELMLKIDEELDDSENDINNILEGQKNIKIINKKNSYYLNRISDLFFRIFSSNNSNIEENIKTGRTGKMENIKKDKMEDLNIVNLAKDIGNKIEKQNEKLDDIIQLTENNIINNRNNIKIINGLL